MTLFIYLIQKIFSARTQCSNVSGRIFVWTRKISKEKWSKIINNCCLCWIPPPRISQKNRMTASFRKCAFHLCKYIASEWIRMRFFFQLIPKCAMWPIWHTNGFHNISQFNWFWLAVKFDGVVVIGSFIPLHVWIVRQREILLRFMFLNGLMNVDREHTFNGA